MMLLLKDSTHRNFHSRNILVRPFVFLVALLSALTPLASGQAQQPNSYAGFEDRKVASVSLSATTLMSTSAFRPMIRQKASQPFSQAAVQQSIAAFQETKLFSQVRLVVTPEPTGLNLVFILEPGYYVGLISFPGAISKFPYTRLLQAVNIPSQSEFTNDLLSQGQNALTHFFQTNGYFLASVTPQMQWDQQHKIANLVFVCRLDKLARLGEIHIDGVSEDEAAKLRGAMNSLWTKLKRSNVKGGQKYDARRIYQGVAEIRKELADEQRLRPRCASFQRTTIRARIAPSSIFKLLWARESSFASPALISGSARSGNLSPSIRKQLRTKASSMKAA